MLEALQISLAKYANINIVAQNKTIDIMIYIYISPSDKMVALITGSLLSFEDITTLRQKNN